MKKSSKTWYNIYISFLWFLIGVSIAFLYASSTIAIITNGEFYG